MKPQDILPYIGSMQQLAYVRPVVYQEGRARGLRAIELENGRLHLEIMADKCLDIASLRLDGQNLSFLAKNGLQGLASYDTNGMEAQRSIMGGLFFTCGPDNVGLPQVEDGVPVPMHGRFRVTPAEHVCCDAFWQEGRYILSVSGEMHVGQLFGSHLILRRKIQTEWGSPTLTIHDEIINAGFLPAPCMLLYHVNAGYPLLQENAQVIIPSQQVIPRDAAAESGLHDWDQMPAPAPGVPEQVFYHKGLPEQVQIGVKGANGHALWLCYAREELPMLTQWKSSASGNYVVGLEPGNCWVEGIARERERGTLQFLEPGETKTVTLHIRAE